MSSKLSSIIRLYERGIITKEKAYELADSKGLSDEEKQILADILDPVVPEPTPEEESTEETPEEEASEEEYFNKTNI